MGDDNLLDEMARFEAEMNAIASASVEAPEASPAPAASPAAAPPQPPLPPRPPQPPQPPQPPRPPQPMPPFVGMPPPPQPMAVHTFLPQHPQHHPYQQPMMGMMQPMPMPVYGVAPPPMDPAVLLHMRQQMGAAAAASATAAVAAQAAQSAIISALTRNASGAAGPAAPIDKDKLHVREVAGERWVDTNMAEWPTDDFRIFVGNLGNEVNDDVLTKAFAKYPTFHKAKVVRNNNTKKSKGYGFVSFLDQYEGAKVLKEMNGKYVGNRPCSLKRSDWQKREVEVTDEEKAKVAKALEANPKARHAQPNKAGSGRPKDRRKHVNVLFHK